jgi:hypothetical protein
MISILKHCELESFRAIDEKSTAEASLVLDYPVPSAVLTDEKLQRPRTWNCRGRFSLFHDTFSFLIDVESRDPERLVVESRQPDRYPQSNDRSENSCEKCEREQHYVRAVAARDTLPDRTHRLNSGRSIE